MSHFCSGHGSPLLLVFGVILLVAAMLRSMGRESR